MTKFAVKQLTNHFSNVVTKDDDRTLGELLAQTIGGLHITDSAAEACELWTQVAKALRLHGLKIEGVQEILCDGEILGGGMMLFLSQLFLTAQSFTRHVVSGKLKGRHQVEGILEFLDSRIDEFRNSKFTLDLCFHPIHECMTIQKFTGTIVDEEMDRNYYWEWTPTVIGGTGDLPS